jgi:hypothetical protein
VGFADAGVFHAERIAESYEIILGEPLDKRFRRRIIEAEIIEPTDDLRSGEDARAAVPLARRRG